MSPQRPFRVELLRDFPPRPIATVLRFVAPDGATALAVPCRLSRERTIVNAMMLDPAWRPDVVCAEEDARIRVQLTPRGAALALARSAARLLGVTRPRLNVPDRGPAVAPVAAWAGQTGLASPSVTIIIPTRDRADLLKRAVETLFTSPNRPGTDLVIVDNGSVESATLGYLEALRRTPGVQVVRLDEPFNFARLVNTGAAVAKGEVLALLNNDVQSNDPNWCDALAKLALDERVGAVGAKLLQPNGRVQHAGITLGVGGLCGHAGRGRAHDDPGPGGMLATTRQVSAVTGACFFTRRSVFERLSGFDERYAVEFNDVDYCLRAKAIGLATVCASHPALVHAEGSSRRASPLRAQEYLDRLTFVTRWGKSLVTDPHYPDGLSYDNEHLSPALAD